MKMEDIEGRRK